MKTNVKTFTWKFVFGVVNHICSFVLFFVCMCVLSNMHNIVFKEILKQISIHIFNNREVLEGNEEKE